MTVYRSIYKDHVLSCTTTPLDDGRFGCHVAVIYMKGDKTTSQRFVDVRETFADEAEAKEKALAAGTDWIDAEANVNRAGLYPTHALKRR
jgi:hypothetical protein